MISLISFQSKSYTKILYSLQRERLALVSNLLQRLPRFMLAPFEYLGNLHDRYLTFLKRVHGKVDGKTLQEVSPQLSGPVLEGLRFLEDDSLLAEMFINILARALDRETASTAHPAFVEILKQLSPDEALILYKIKKRSYEFHVQSDFDHVNHRFSNDQVIRNDFPVDELVYPENYVMYINHLSYLNVAGIPEYKEQKYLYDGSGNQNGIIVYRRTQFHDFGELFSACCIPDDFHN